MTNDSAISAADSSIPQVNIASGLSDSGIYAETASRQPYVRLFARYENISPDNITAMVSGKEFVNFPTSDLAFDSLIRISDVIPHDVHAASLNTLIAIRPATSLATGMVFVAWMAPTWEVTSYVLDAFWVEQLLNSTGLVGDSRVQAPNIAKMLHYPVSWHNARDFIIVEGEFAKAVVDEYLHLFDFDTDSSAVTGPQTLASVFALALSDVCQIGIRPYGLQDGIKRVQDKTLLPAYIASKELHRRYRDILSFTKYRFLDPSKMYTLEFHRSRTGYGYSSADTTVILSLTVIGLYLLLMLAYIVFTLVTGETGTSWDSTGSCFCSA